MTPRLTLSLADTEAFTDRVKTVGANTRYGCASQETSSARVKLSLWESHRVSRLMSKLLIDAEANSGTVLSHDVPNFPLAAERPAEQSTTDPRACRPNT